MSGYIFSAILLSLLVTHPLAAVDLKEIQELRHAKICNLSADAILNQLQWINSNWFDTKKSSYAIETNFDNVVDIHESFFKDMHKFARFMALEVKSLDELRKERLNLETEYRNAHLSFAKSDDADMGFTLSAASLEAAANSLHRDVLYLILECPEYKDQLPKLEKTINSWSESINTYRSYIDQVKRKRMVLFDTAYRQSVLGLTNALHRLAVGNLNETKKVLVETLDLDIWHTKVQTWWTEVSIVNGIGSGLHTKYLQFIPALRQMHSDLGQISIFEEELSKMPTSQAANKFMLDLRSYKDMLKSEIEKLLENGWEGQLKRQIILSTARGKTKTSETCIKAINNHLQSARSACNSEKFHETETLYAISVDQCTAERDIQ